MSRKTAKLDRVTVTGADESVDPADVLRLATRYPLAEVAILFGSGLGHAPRFPGVGWVVELLRAWDSLPLSPPGERPKLACHLCGEWVRHFLTFEDAPVPFLGNFGRYQLNTHAQPHVVDLGALRKSVERLSATGTQVIFQVDNVNDELFEWARHARARPLLSDLRKLNVAALFDLSHGSGLLPAEWPRSFVGSYCGYAGGLSPENVSGQLDRIVEEADGPFWVDAETHLRSGDDRVFDLVKIESFLAAAGEWARRRNLESASP